MAIPKIGRLVEALAKQTNEGKIRWQQTAFDGIYQVSFTNISAQISREGNDIWISLRNSEGLEIEKFSDVEAGQAGLQNSYDLMGRLYETARREALGVDKAIDDLLLQLGDDDLLR